MPRLNAKAAAEMLGKPMHKQAQVLREQKFPAVGSQAFKIPYYQKALQGMASCLQSDNSQLSMDSARSSIDSLNDATKRANNRRAFEAFVQSEFAQRDVDVSSAPRIHAMIDDVEFRASPDFRLHQEDGESFAFVSCKATAISEDVARATLEIAHWIFEQNGTGHPMRAFEFVDLSTGSVRSWRRRRIGTIRVLHENAALISALWPTLEQAA